MAYSDIVNEIQGDKNKAAHLLVQIAKDQKKALEKIKRLEDDLQKANNYYKSTMREVEMVCKHVKISPHFHIIKDKKYYHFDKNYQVKITNIDWEL